MLTPPEIVRSLDREPESWEFRSDDYLYHNSGVVLCIHGFSTENFPRVTSPIRVSFRWWNRWLIASAVHRWKDRHVAMLINPKLAKELPAEA